MPEKKVTIELSREEALVLFEFVSAFSDTDQLLIHDQAEQRVLWNICASLEKILVEPFHANYSELLAEARKRVRDKD